MNRQGNRWQPETGCDIHKTALQLHSGASGGVLPRQIIGGEVEIALTDGDGATRAGFQLTRIVLIEDALGALDARKRNFGGAINARLGIDGEINQSGKGEQECEEQRKEQLRK